jgi:hypothetical protein
LTITTFIKQQELKFKLQLHDNEYFQKQHSPSSNMAAISSLNDKIDKFKLEPGEI